MVPTCVKVRRFGTNLVLPSLGRNNREHVEIWQIVVNNELVRASYFCPAWEAVHLAQIYSQFIQGAPHHIHANNADLADLPIFGFIHHLPFGHSLAERDSMAPLQPRRLHIFFYILRLEELF